MSWRRRTAPIGAVALALALAAACSDNTSPGVEPEVSNLPDNFQFQITAMQNYSRALQYSWSDGGTRANVDQSTVLSGGTATLILRDANGVQRYSRDLSENGSFVSDSGATGMWTIQVVFSDASGDVNFRVQKP